MHQRAAAGTAQRGLEDRSDGDPAGRLRKASSVTEILRWRAEHQPDRLAYTFLADDDHVESLTYASLDRRARTVAARLRSEGGAGERALLLYPAGLDLLTGLFGCLYAGVIAVPLYPPKLSRRDMRWLDVSGDAGPRFALTTSSVVAELDGALSHSPELADLCWVASDAPPDGSLPHAGEEGRTFDPGATAYLQYTSGSTRSPKGVIVSHGNLLANIEDIDRGFRHDDTSVTVSWLPHFHDMGLVYGLIAPLALGFPCYFMSPASFLQRPFRWLQAISRFGATHSGGPNFTYDLCAARITAEQKRELDLSRWAVAFNGAEPVRRETLQRFAEAFACCGFAPEALCSAYGLAEATLKVTSNRRGRGTSSIVVSASALGRGRVADASDLESDRRTLVGCGRPEAGTEILIVHPETHVPCADDEVGEIWVASPSVAVGYWRRPEESALTFQARLSGDPERGPFLRTGDLGLIRDGALFVTGRIKDLIIVRGRNHYPHDIELTVQNSHPSLRQGAGAAFALEVGGEERLVVVQEIYRHRQDEAGETVERIRAAIVEEHEVAPYAIVLARQHSVPKTSSGKLQRSACRRAFVEGALPIIVEWREGARDGTERVDAAPAAPRPASEASREEWIAYVEERLRHHVASVLRRVPAAVDVHQPVVSMGIDSLTAVELKHQIEEELGVELALMQLIQGPSLAELARALVGVGKGGSASAPETETRASGPSADGRKSLLLSILSLNQSSREGAV
jgi:acyl-CoA synthetase (AMP-forming)/AMP-acid ligase II/acyl carrier protein